MLGCATPSTSSDGAPVKASCRFLPFHVPCPYASNPIARRRWTAAIHIRPPCRGARRRPSHAQVYQIQLPPRREAGRQMETAACGSSSLCCRPTGGRLPIVAGLEPASEPGRMRRLAATLPRLTQGRPSAQKRFEHARCKVSSALLERLQRQPAGGAYKVFQAVSAPPRHPFRAVPGPGSGGPPARLANAPAKSMPHPLTPSRHPASIHRR